MKRGGTHKLKAWSRGMGEKKGWDTLPYETTLTHSFMYYYLVSCQCLHTDVVLNPVITPQLSQFLLSHFKIKYNFHFCKKKSCLFKYLFSFHWARQLKQQHSWRLFRTWQVKILAGIILILIEVFPHFPQSLQQMPGQYNILGNDWFLLHPMQSHNTILHYTI
jgi:hypothetical protein